MEKNNKKYKIINVLQHLHNCNFPNFSKADNILKQKHIITIIIIIIKFVNHLVTIRTIRQLFRIIKSKMYACKQFIISQIIYYQ